jgi:hypothetical protein
MRDNFGYRVKAISIKEEIIIQTEPSSVWNKLIDISHWRSWSRIIDRAVLYGQFREGTFFKCRSGNWDFECQINAILQGKRFGCSGKSIGLEVNLVWEISGGQEISKVVLSGNIGGWLTRLPGNRLRREFEGAIFTWLYALKGYSERGQAELPGDSKRRGGLKKRTLELHNPFEFRAPRRIFRRDDDD